MTTSSQLIASELDSILHSNLSELFYQSIGSTWFTDTIFLYVLTPLDIISLVFNVSCCFGVASNAKMLTNLPLYRILFAYAVNNCLVAAVIMFSFSAGAPRYIPFFFSIYSRIHRCFFVNYVLAVLYFVGKMLEILILFERLGNFYPRLKAQLASAHLFRMRTTLPIIFVFAAVFSIPFYLRRTVKSDELLLEELMHFNETRIMYYCHQSPLVSTTAGLTFLFLSVLIREFLTLGVEIALSVWLVVSFRRFLTFKLSAHNYQESLSRVFMRSAGIRAANGFRLASFRKTTRTIMSFAIVSVAFNMAYSILYLLLAYITSNTFGTNASALFILMLITKPFQTFYVFYKLDKNIANRIDALRFFRK